MNRFPTAHFSFIFEQCFNKQSYIVGCRRPRRPENEICLLVHDILTVKICYTILWVLHCKVLLTLALLLVLIQFSVVLEAFLAAVVTAVALVATFQLEPQ